MILPFVGFISLTPPVGTPLQLERWRGALQTGIWTGNIVIIISKLGRHAAVLSLSYKTKKRPFELLTCDLHLATFPYMLEFFQATIRFNHQGVALRWISSAFQADKELSTLSRNS